jgi:hypothetical protein
MNIESEFDIKRVFYTDQKYNAIKLLETSIYETAVCIKLELEKHNKSNELLDESKYLDKFMNFYNKFIVYEFCKNNMNSRFQLESTDENKLLKDSNLIELYQTFYDKLNLVVNDLMGDLDYNPNRVSIKNKSSVFLIAYAKELKELWEELNEEFVQNLMDKNLEDTVFRSEYFNTKLKFTPPSSAKGVWAKAPLNFNK